ncbi:MAG: phage holin family protein [Candidatus Saccharimonadales bacterium]
MAHLIIRFLIRWVVSSLGLWIAAGLLGGRLSYENSLGVIVVAGVVLAIINTLLKPFLILISLPAIFLSLGLFMIVINGLTVFLTSEFYPSLHFTSFWVAIFAGMVVGLVNLLVSTILG